MGETYNNSKGSEAEEPFSIKKYLQACVKNWRWFLFSILMCTSIGTFYVMRQERSYQRSMSVLIKDEESASPASGMSSALSSFGISGTNTNVNNELISMTSPAIMAEVISRLGLNVNYQKEGWLRNTTLYGKSNPINVRFLDLQPQEAAAFRVEFQPGGKVTLKDFVKRDENGRQKFDKEVTAKIGFEPVQTPVGRVVISPNGAYEKQGEPIEKMLVYCLGRQEGVEEYAEMVTGGLADIDAEVIDLTARDVVPQRAEDILNMIVTVYNERWIEDKNKVAIATSDFITSRLNIIEQELGVVETDISDYKSSHRITDLKESAKINMQKEAEVSNNMLSVSNQLAMATYLRDYINNPTNQKSVIPVNTGTGSAALESQISTYNNLLLARNSLAAESSETNPLVVDYDAKLRGQREAISKAIAVNVGHLQNILGGMRGAKGEANSELAEAPVQAKYLLNVERQQNVKQSLYLYLLQKREENELKQTYTADNTRILTPPMGSLKPIAPKRMVVVAFSFLLGLFIPALVIYIVGLTDTHVHSRNDLERMATPFIGEIPFVGKRKKSNWLRKLFGRKESEGELENVVDVVREGSRDVVSESFRIIRGNIDLMNRGRDAKKRGEVIMVTSFNPGSGKSFIAYNLASSFALKGKSVLVVDGDLRHGSLSQFVGMPTSGSVNYLAEHTDNWQQFIQKPNAKLPMDVMPIGYRPPNPAELLDNGRIGTLLQEAAEIYDYVLIDCPPVDVVVDTQILENYIDRTVFVVRAGLLDKSFVAEIDKLYQQGRFKKMSVVLNGIEVVKSRYGSYGAYGSKP